MKDKVKNDDIRKKTGLRKLEDIIKERRLRWLGHVIRMEDSRIPHQATQWELTVFIKEIDDDDTRGSQDDQG